MVENQPSLADAFEYFRSDSFIKNFDPKTLMSIGKGSFGAVFKAKESNTQ
jgi:hypothetical protein